MCGAGRGMLVGKGGAACPAFQGLECHWVGAQISPLLLQRGKWCYSCQGAGTSLRAAALLG